jgi:hypothetical protein
LVINTKYQLFLAETPFQVLCCLEAKHKFNCDNAILIIRHSAETNNNKQINNIINSNNIWRKVFIAKTNFKIFFVWLLMMLIEIDEVYISTIFGWQYLFRSHRRIRKIIHVDDGIETLQTQNNILQISNPVSKKLLISNNVPSWLIGKRELTNVIDLFTVIKGLNNTHNKQSVDINNFMYLKRYTKSNNDFYVPIMILGGNWVEQGFFEIFEYVKCLKYIINFIGCSDSIYYYPHRRESSINLNTLSSIEGLSVLKSDMPIELYLLSLKTRPTEIYSLVSTACLTVHSIFDDIPLYMFKATHLMNKSPLIDINIVTNAEVHVESVLGRNNVYNMTL